MLKVKRKNKYNSVEGTLKRERGNTSVNKQSINLFNYILLIDKNI